eukprot:scaffold814_cov248-Chaetoceros_neogracile.AAC.8
MAQPWLPNNTDDDDIFAVDDKREELERKSIQVLASLIRYRLQNTKNDDSDDTKMDAVEQSEALNLAHNRFRDLTCTIKGEIFLERVFATTEIPELEHQNGHEHLDSDVIKGAVIALQSLAILGMQIGVKGTPQQKERSVAHLNNMNDDKESKGLDAFWDGMDNRRLKHQSDITAGTQLLAELKMKRTAQSAFDLLVRLGAWTKHEDLALLRSGFPTRFTAEEEKHAKDAAEDVHDPDHILGIRKDLRHLKVYTVDSESTDEIDDGLSIEVIKKADGSERKKIWIHIADADRWAPRSSKIFKAAQHRATSLYLASGSIPMFPLGLSGGPMSLIAEKDSHALSMAVELNDDGSIDDSSLVITPSLVNVNYRLAYDEVDEMLEMGVGYFEEWELGALLDEATKRRKYRVSCGSTEGFVPNPIPQAQLKAVKKDDGDDVDIILNVEMTHNAGLNQSEAVLDSTTAQDFAPPISSAFLLVTEMMVMSSEAMGKLKHVLESQTKRVKEDNGHLPIVENMLSLPYRTQPRPDFGKRYQDLETLNSMKNKGYCHAWYARRFFEAVRVKDEPLPHNGLGIDCYVQWSSPIRRFCDLQVHASVKRFLRRHRVNLLMEAGRKIPEALTASDLGCDVPIHVDSSRSESGSYTEYTFQSDGKKHDINYNRGIGFVKAARMVQRKSNEYWLFEYIRRNLEESESEVVYQTTVLACVDPSRGQYAIFVHELGLEHRYLSEQGELPVGSKLWLKVSTVQPRLGLLTFTLSSVYGGKSKRFAQAA